MTRIMTLRMGSSEAIPWPFLAWNEGKQVYEVSNGKHVVASYPRADLKTAHEHLTLVTNERKASAAYRRMIERI